MVIVANYVFTILKFIAFQCLYHEKKRENKNVKDSEDT